MKMTSGETVEERIQASLNHAGAKTGKCDAPQFLLKTWKNFPQKYLAYDNLVKYYHISIPISRSARGNRCRRAP
jgi:hypothetical protein